MRTLHKYIASAFVTTFLMALLVLSFVMTIGLLFKATSLIAKGASLDLVLGFLWAGFPYTLSYSTPIATLVSALLVFGRLSSDNEITAMRACGISFSKIMRMPVLIALLLSVFCLYINNDVAPESSYSRKTARYKVKVSDITALIEPGKNIDDFPGYKFRVESRDGNTLHGLHIFETTNKGNRRTTKAKTAYIVVTNAIVTNLVAKHSAVTATPEYTVTTNDIVSLDMRDVTFEEDNTGSGKAARVVKNIIDNESSGASKSGLRRRVKDKSTCDLMKDILVARIDPPQSEDGREEISKSLSEVNNRISFAFACFCFVIVGVPLGIKQHRKESSVGIGISLGIAGGFYLFNIMSESLARKPEFYTIAPAIAWIPVLICIILGIIFASKNQ